ncbi:hypothetical protein PanWU01x14_269390, partial [Parasponia andersonii]
QGQTKIYKISINLKYISIRSPNYLFISTTSQIFSINRIWITNSNTHLNSSTPTFISSCLNAVFLSGGVPFLTLSRSFIILRSFCSSGNNSSSSSSFHNAPKYR